MKQFIKDFFSDSNTINERTFFAVLFFILFVVVIVLKVDMEVIYTVAGLFAGCLGISIVARK